MCDCQQLLRATAANTHSGSVANPQTPQADQHTGSAANLQTPAADEHTRATAYFPAATDRD